MKFFLSFLMALSLPLVVLAQGGPGPVVKSANAPKVTCAHPNFDFKNVDEGPDIIHEFHCRNRGVGKLIVTNVSTSCGCTAAVLKKLGAKAGSDDKASYPVTVMPGSAFIIKATYHTSGRPGHATKIITVTSNDPVTPGFQLKLDMTVVRDIEIHPDRLYLYGLKHGEAHSSPITVYGKPGMPLNVLSAQSSNGVVTVSSIVPYKDDNKDPTQVHSGAIIQVDVSAAQTIGSFTDNIDIKTDSVKKPDITVPVLGEVNGKVQFNPKSLYFAPQQSSPITITFTADQPQSFTIRQVESTKHLVRPYIIKSMGPSGFDQYSLVVSVNKNLPKESDGKDEVIVYTNDDEQPKISIDVQANK
jgi:hypothetical protein